MRLKLLRIALNLIWVVSNDFEKHGPDAIVAMRKEKPSDYIRMVASLMPRALEVSTATTILDAMSLDELEESLATLKRMQLTGDVTDVEVKAKTQLGGP